MENLNNENQPFEMCIEAKENGHIEVKSNGMNMLEVDSFLRIVLRRLEQALDKGMTDEV